jgi:hypothetical protein
MTPAVFSAFLLDLTPTGSHVLEGDYKIDDSKGSDGTTISVSSSTNEGITINPSEIKLLSLSDSISRARLLSVAEVGGALPNAMRLWWTVLLVSGLATLFVTFQAKMRRPPEDASPEQRKGMRWANWRYEFVAFMAITLSITGTTLTALKQYYDPTRALVQNEYTLRELRKLHQEIVLTVACKEETGAGGAQAIREVAAIDEKKMNDWALKMTELQRSIVPPYAATGSLNQSVDKQL